MTTLANKNFENTFQIAKQVLVVRWACKHLLDSKCPSNAQLIREMRLYHKDTSYEFKGTIGEIEKDFRVDYDFRNVELYDANGNKTSEYIIK